RRWRSATSGRWSSCAGASSSPVSRWSRRRAADGRQRCSTNTRAHRLIRNDEAFMNPARTGRYATLGVVVVLAVIGAIWALTHRASAENQPVAKGPPAVPVTSTLVRAQDVPLYRTGVGTVVAAQSVTVKPRIDGQLDKVAFTEGQDVKAGQLLVQ